MNFSDTIQKILIQHEEQTVEFKAVMLPSRAMAQLIASFANTDGGHIILGVSTAEGQTVVHGLSPDFRANDILHKALDLLSPAPTVTYQYVPINGKNIYGIDIPKSAIPILLEGKEYKRVNGSIELVNAPKVRFNSKGYNRLSTINQHIESGKKGTTHAFQRIVEHYQGALRIADDLGHLLYPVSPQTPTSILEGKILSRILFSSLVDNFETYLSDLLYEIFLANPATLKSKQQVTIEEVLNCADIQEFVHYWAKEKLSNLQKGSVKGFIKENKQISQLNVLDEDTQNQIESILQIRHLYAHRNGIVDEKFLQFFPGLYTLNREHQLSIEGICVTLEYLHAVMKKLDQAAVIKFKLSTIG